MATRTLTKKSVGAKSRAQSTGKKKNAPKKRVSRKVVATKPAKNSENSSEALTLLLDSVLVVNNASNMHAKLSSYLEESTDKIVVDASLVEMIDTAMIQLLFSLITDLKSRNVEIVWREPSAEFVSRVHSLGLAEIFGINSMAEG